ncbi:hypothetical protein ACIRU5_36275 [Streptomyces misionensis]|uniref:hypothetical protein n=1 Tax=Streptomyces misionensis TaxID=67331 RepID=UPI003801E7F9
MAGERVRWPSVVDRAREIVNGYAPMKVTLRQVMYRLVSDRTLPHTAPMYRRLSAQLAKARREGRFPDLIDTVREGHVPPAWTGADAFLAEMPGWFRLDRTAGQEHALYVAAEKDTLRQQLTGWLADAGIPVLVVRGFGSQSYADVVHDSVTADPRDAVLLVVDRHGQRVWGAVTTLLDAERVRLAIGSVQVPFGTCSEPSNVAAGGGACPLRFRCMGCDHYSTDISYLPELAAYLDGLLRQRDLEARLSEILGEQVWRESGIGGPDDAGQLQARITTLEQQVVDLELTLQDRDDDLAAARAANHELMAQLNRGRDTPQPPE